MAHGACTQPDRWRASPCAACAPPVARTALVGRHGRGAQERRGEGAPGAQCAWERHLAREALALVSQRQQDLLQIVRNVDHVHRVRVVLLEHAVLGQLHLRGGRFTV